MASRKEVVTRTKQIVEGDDDDQADENEGVSLFDSSEVSSKRIERVRVIRREPNEGFLGEAEPTVTEEELSQKWGGGVLRLEAKNGKGLIVQVKTLKIAGDPKFKSEAAEAEWRRENRMPPAGAARGAADTISIRDFLLMQERNEAKRSAEAREAAELERQRAEEREAKMRAEADEREARRKRDEDEREDRRLKLAREDDERRAQQHARDLERMKADNDRMMQSQTQLFTQTLALFKTEAKADPLEPLMRGIELAQRLGGGEAGAGASNPLMAIFNRAPEVLRELRLTAGAAANELRGGGGQAEGEEAEPEAGGAPGDSLVLTGRTAALLRAVGQRMADQGQDPELALAKLAALYLKSTGKPKPAPAAQAAAPAPAELPAQPPAQTPRVAELAGEAPAPRSAPRATRPAPRAPSAPARMKTAGRVPAPPRAAPRAAKPAPNGVPAPVKRAPRKPPSSRSP